MRALPALLCAALLAPFAATAAPIPAFEPLAFLAGHCWKGAMPDGKATDEHCFAWVYDGKFLRDRHVVRKGAEVLYQGETLYYWNPTEGKSFGFRGSWKRVGENAYEVLREYQTDTGWMPVRMMMKKLELLGPGLLRRLGRLNPPGEPTSGFHA